MLLDSVFMTRSTAALLAFGCLLGFSAQGLTGAPAPAVPASPSENGAVERFLADIEKLPVAYQARRRLEASSSKLQESAWMEAISDDDPAVGLTYSIVAQGGLRADSPPCAERGARSGAGTFHRSRSGAKRICRMRTTPSISAVRPGDGMLKMQLTPRRRDSRLVLGSALLTAESGNLIRVEGRLSKSPSFWLGWVKVSRSYSPVGSFHDAHLRRINRGRPHGGHVDIFDDVRLSDGRWPGGQFRKDQSARRSIAPSTLPSTLSPQPSALSPQPSALTPSLHPHRTMLKDVSFIEFTLNGERSASKPAGADDPARLHSRARPHRRQGRLRRRRMRRLRGRAGGRRHGEALPAVNSCLMFLPMAAGHEIYTVEVARSRRRTGRRPAAMAAAADRSAATARRASS